ncbi:MAG: hypothetical protein Q8R92_07815 [Deltaproteobacteria bacterium]|nr:hypothetical protein [Deltaproteobacteria bacterium]
MRLSLVSVGDQKAALKKLAELAERSTLHPRIREAAGAITNDLRARDDAGELEAIFNAVKHGSSKVPGLKNGFRYVADPRLADLFIAPFRALEMCQRGSCGSDCDDHAALVTSLAGSLGFRMGLRAWGPENTDEFVHVYAVAALPKRNPKQVVGLDTTVPESFVGWEPPRGHVLTAWLE